MSFLLSLALVLAAAVCALVGFVAGAPAMLFLAAACSAAAVLIIWRRTVAMREQPFVAQPPTHRQPEWDRSFIDLRDRKQEEDDARADGPVPTDDDIGIPEYGSLTAAEVLPSLETMSVEQLRAVIAREKAGLNREGIIRRAGRLIGLTTGEIKLDLNNPSLAHERSLADSHTRNRGLSL